MTRKKIVIALALVLTMALSIEPALAHRVNIFAYVEGGEVVVECGFNRSQKVRQGRVEVRDASTDQLLIDGVTGDDGTFRFAIPAEARNSSHDLKVLINAGEGHQNEWIVPAGEFGVAMGSADPSNKVPASSVISSSSATSSSRTASPASAAGVQGARGAASSAVSPALSEKHSVVDDTSKTSVVSEQGNWATSADVERIVNATMEMRLAPIKKMLAEQYESGPNLKDIIGGIGWILGLVGVAAYFRRRP